jgi:hypothetical protein
MSPEVIDRLVEAGHREGEAFMKSALVQIRRVSNDCLACTDEDDVLNALVSVADKAHEVMIVMKNAEWIWRLFPTVLLWLMQPVRVRVVLCPFSGSNERANEDERRRRALLFQMGAQVIETGQIPFQGFIVNGSDADAPAGILYLDRVNSSLPRAMCYEGPEH